FSSSSWEKMDALRSQRSALLVGGHPLERRAKNGLEVFACTQSLKDQRLSTVDGLLVREKVRLLRANRLGREPPDEEEREEHAFIFAGEFPDQHLPESLRTGLWVTGVPQGGRAWGGFRFEPREPLLAAGCVGNRGVDAHAQVLQKKG